MARLTFLGGLAWLWARTCLAQPNLPGGTVVLEVSGDGPPFLSMDDAAPMGLRDIASVFPFSGPFAPGSDGTPGDRFLHEALASIPDRGFLDQLVPVIQARFEDMQHPCTPDVNRLCPHADSPLHCLGMSGSKLSKGCVEEIKHAVPFVCSEQIKAFCSDDLEKGVLPCLEEQGRRLGEDCSDAIVAARHAISSLGASKKKALQAPAGKKKGSGGENGCPRGWSGPVEKGCCTKRWAPNCEAMCSATQCHSHSAGDWDFKWLDFRVNPYTCCPKPKHEKYVGGQPICPAGWKLEPKKQGSCCRRAWSWSCGHGCAEAQCAGSAGFTWMPVAESREPYRCCPAGEAAAIAAAASFAQTRPKSGAEGANKPEPKPLAAEEDADMPDALGMSWVSRPVNLANGGWTGGAFIVAIIAVCLLARKWLAGNAGGAPSGRGGYGGYGKDL